MVKSFNGIRIIYFCDNGNNEEKISRKKVNLVANGKLTLWICFYKTSDWYCLIKMNIYKATHNSKLYVIQ
jgi:hypothetical protein